MIDDDIIGCVLEFGLLNRKGANTQSQYDWEHRALGHSPSSPRGGSISLSRVWLGNNVDPNHLVDVLVTYCDRRAFPNRTKKDIELRISRVLRLLNHHGLVEPIQVGSNVFHITPVGVELWNDDSYREYVCGLPYVVKRWRDSVVYLHSPGEAGIGTGFLVAKDLVATARHVVEALKDIHIGGLGPKDVKVANVRLPADNLLDLALLQLPEGSTSHLQPMRAACVPELLDEVVVMGFPPIYLTKNPYLVVNRGELSSMVEFYDGMQGLVITCLLRGGNSGGPVLNRRGQVVGIVSRNLHQQVGPHEPSVNESLGYAAVIPIEWLVDLLKNKV